MTKDINILIAFEQSGVTRRAFERFMGENCEGPWGVVSCDLLLSRSVVTLGMDGVCQRMPSDLKLWNGLPACGTLSRNRVSMPLWKIQWGSCLSNQASTFSRGNTVTLSQRRQDYGCTICLCLGKQTTSKRSLTGYQKANSNGSIILVRARTGGSLDLKLLKVLARLLLLNMAKF